MKKTTLTVALTAVLGFGAFGAQAAPVNAGDVLTIQDGVPNLDANGYITSITTGSWFGMDTDKNSKIAGTEQTPIDGLNGITIGSTQTPGDIDQWMFFGNQGQDYTTVAPTGSTEAGINMSGWTVLWNGVNVPMGSGAWTPLNCGAAHMGCTGVTFASGVGAFSWDGVYGSTYELWYTATVPAGDASGFGNVQYLLYLTGTVEAGTPAVPVPAAAWLLGSGLVGLVGVARRRKTKA